MATNSYVFTNTHSCRLSPKARISSKREVLGNWADPFGNTAPSAVVVIPQGDLAMI